MVEERRNKRGTGSSADKIESKTSRSQDKNSINYAKSYFSSSTFLYMQISFITQTGRQITSLKFDWAMYDLRRLLELNQSQDT